MPALTAVFCCVIDTSIRIDEVRLAPALDRKPDVHPDFLYPELDPDTAPCLDSLWEIHLELAACFDLHFVLVELFTLLPSRKQDWWWGWGASSRWC